MLALTPKQDRYDTFDDGLSICATEVDEMVDLSEGMNSDSNTEIDHGTPIKTATFANVLYCLETGEIYLSLMPRDVKDAVFSSVHSLGTKPLLSEEAKISSNIC
ncbi:hypothetical protein TNCV_1410681 [Trichonephila clavipes]|nr:hypothetical protein TNCV_1410681 [Trichonephila clavipes]